MWLKKTSIENKVSKTGDIHLHTRGDKMIIRKYKEQLNINTIGKIFEKRISKMVKMEYMNISMF